MCLVFGTPSHGQSCTRHHQPDYGCPFHKVVGPQRNWCLLDRFNKYELTFYVKPGNSFTQLTIKLNSNSVIDFGRDRLPDTEKWYKISIRSHVRLIKVDYHASIDDRQFLTVPIFFTASNLEVYLYGSSFYSKSCDPGNFPPPASNLPLPTRTNPPVVANTERENSVNTTLSLIGNTDDEAELPSTSEFIYGQPWWIIAAGDQISKETPTTAIPMQVQGFVNPANTYDNENYIYENIRKLGYPVHNGEESFYENIIELRHSSHCGVRPVPSHDKEQEAHTSFASQNNRGSSHDSENSLYGCL
ncbi:hypothetical protein SK128_008945 [Halocaridina rubra]|uniref:Uncharacterized protein n=1 Tax=Halocaridina rubra TaxID=373956 RepID=A0AAN8XK88_HALRR